MRFPITPGLRVYLAPGSTDMRKSFRGLVAATREVLEEDPTSGHLFGFCNRRRTQLKLLLYDGQGFWLCQKRLSSGRFKHWAQPGPSTRQVVAHELSVLLAGGDFAAVRAHPLWRNVVR